MCTWSGSNGTQTSTGSDTPHFQIDYTQSNDCIPWFSVVRFESCPSTSMPISQTIIKGAKVVSNGFLLRAFTHKWITIHQSHHSQFERLPDTMWLNITIVNHNNHHVLTADIPVVRPASDFVEPDDFFSKAEGVALLVQKFAPIIYYIIKGEGWLPCDFQHMYSI